MSAEVLTAIISAIAAIVGALVVAIPSAIQAKQTSELYIYRIEQLEANIKRLSDKLTVQDDIRLKIKELDIRLNTCEKQIQTLEQDQHNKQ
jgi:phage terminase Nu1 subunit (DNA packaging protein)